MTGSSRTLAILGAMALMTAAGQAAENKDSVPSAASVPAAAQDLWSWHPLQRVDPPQTRDKHWARTPIDQFILARLESNRMTPNPPADKRTLLRRVTFDLTGLPPRSTKCGSFWRIAPRTRSRKWSTGCSPARVMANAGRAIGWMWCILRKP